MNAKPNNAKTSCNSYNGMNKEKRNTNSKMERVFYFYFIDINSMPHHIVILHALHNLSFSFTITFTFNNHKTIVQIHYNFNKNIFDVQSYN